MNCYTGRNIEDCVTRLGNTKHKFAMKRCKAFVCLLFHNVSYNYLDMITLKYVKFPMYWLLILYLLALLHVARVLRILEFVFFVLVSIVRGMLLGRLAGKIRAYVECEMCARHAQFATFSVATGDTNGKKLVAEDVAMSNLHPVFTCSQPGGEKSYEIYNNLLRHYQQEKSHKPAESLKKRVVSASQAAENFLPDSLNVVNQVARIKEFFKVLAESELTELVLPNLFPVLTPWEFLYSKLCFNPGLSGKPKATEVVKEYEKLRQAVATTFPELASFIYQSSNTCVNQLTTHSGTTLEDRNSFKDICSRNKEVLGDWLCSLESAHILTDHIMPHVYEVNRKPFVDFTCELVNSFGIGQRDTQDLLRNTIGRRLSKSIGVNIIPPKDEIIVTLSARKSHLSKTVGLQFEEHDGIVVGYTIVKQYIKFLLSQPGLCNVLDLSKKALLIYSYGNLAPFLKWSRHFTGMTSLRLKIVEPHNMLSLVITLGMYLGPDDYSTLKACFGPLYNQLANLKTVELSGEQVKILYRCGGDGKQRREETGSSSAKLTYPIPEAPEHTKQLGDMKTVCSEPVWSVEDAKTLATDYSDWLGGKPDNQANRRLFAKLHLGNQGRCNITGTRISNNYPGTFHLAVRIVESICLRIANCAHGKFLRSSEPCRAVASIKQGGQMPPPPNFGPEVDFLRVNFFSTMQ